MTTGALFGYYVICIRCGHAAAVRRHGARRLRCSNNDCVASRKWITKRAWGFRNCQGICGRFEFGVSEG